MRSPDFFLVGAPKCGTTALYEMLGAHPEIFVSPIKEPDFFASDIRASVVQKEAINDWSQYLRLFNGAGPEQAVGEGSVSYLASRVAAAAIYKRNPHARILMVLRDPADRLFSHYSAAIAARSTRDTFADWLRGVAAREQTDPAPTGPVVAGRYGVSFQRYLAVFPASRIHIVWYDDYVTDTAATVRLIFRFLGVDETQQVPVDIRRNETRVVKSRVLSGIVTLANLFTDGLADRIGLTARYNLRFSSTDREAAIRLYEDDIRRLADLTGRDLSRWTSVKG